MGDYVTAMGAPKGGARCRRALMLTTLCAAGVARVVFFVPSAIADTVLPLLDGYVAVAKKVG